MSDRPKLDKNLDGKTFREFYYLKEDLVDFVADTVYRHRAENLK